MNGEPPVAVTVAEPVEPPLHATLEEAILVDSVLEKAGTTLPLVTPPGATQLPTVLVSAKLFSVPV